MLLFILRQKIYFTRFKRVPRWIVKTSTNLALCSRCTRLLTVHCKQVEIDFEAFPEPSRTAARGFEASLACCCFVLLYKVKLLKDIKNTLFLQDLGTYLSRALSGKLIVIEIVSCFILGTYFSMVPSDLI